MIVAITGGARGIGLATAKRLAAGGAQIGLGDIDEAALEEATREIPGRVVARPLDVRDEESFAAFLQAVVDEFGGLDVLVNNAGIMPVGPLLAESGDVARRMFDINVHGVLIGMKLAVPLLQGRPGARIVNLASYAGKLPVPLELGFGTYANETGYVVFCRNETKVVWSGTAVFKVTSCTSGGPAFVNSKT